jgi:putative endonuclease
VARVYQQRGCDLLATRWRGQAGELALILRQGAVVVFAEVKASRTRDRAAARITPAQVRRIYAAAEEFLAGQPGGQLTEVRFDAALVSGTGEIEVIENAFGLD